MTSNVRRDTESKTSPRHWTFRSSLRKLLRWRFLRVLVLRYIRAPNDCPDASYNVQIQRQHLVECKSHPWSHSFSTNHQHCSLRPLVIFFSTRERRKIWVDFHPSGKETSVYRYPMRKRRAGKQNFTQVLPGISILRDANIVLSKRPW